MPVDSRSVLILTGLLLATLITVNMILPYFETTVHPSPHTQAIDTPDTDKQIELRNAFGDTAVVQITVRRNSTDKHVYNETHTLAPGEETDSIYNLNQSNPDGIETYTLTAAALNQTETTELRTTQCQGGAVVEITERGQLYSFYAIC